ncbi:hypothetical protein AB4084_13395, partial [Lysobacter sp. 2RAB21]
MSARKFIRKRSHFVPAICLDAPPSGFVGWALLMTRLQGAIMKTLFATLALCAALVASTATSAHDNDAACLAPGAQVIDAGSFSFT